MITLQLKKSVNYLADYYYYYVFSKKKLEMLKQYSHDSMLNSLRVVGLQFQIGQCNRT
jgi:hypothetical protein